MSCKVTLFLLIVTFCHSASLHITVWLYFLMSDFLIQLHISKCNCLIVNFLKIASTSDLGKTSCPAGRHSCYLYLSLLFIFLSLSPLVQQWMFFLRGLVTFKAHILSLRVSCMCSEWNKNKTINRPLVFEEDSYMWERNCFACSPLVFVMLWLWTVITNGNENMKRKIWITVMHMLIFPLWWFAPLSCFQFPYTACRIYRPLSHLVFYLMCHASIKWAFLFWQRKMFQSLMY